MVLLLLAVMLIGASIRKKNIALNPEYEYFVKGLWTKIFGGLFFGSIYVFYYGQGDTTSYYECSLSFVKLLHHDFGHFLTVLFGDGTQEMKSYFTSETGEPMMYMFGEAASRFTMKLLVPFMLVTNGSYFLTTVLVSIVTYGGLWQLYRMFVSYFPAHRKNLAIAILFMPSVMFWGSGILKDSFTLASTCYLVVVTNDIIRRNGSMVWNIVKLIFFAYLVVSIKAYIIIILLPSTLVWMFYERISKIKSKLIRYMIVPFVYITIILGSYIGLTAFGERLGKFSVSKALTTAAVNQNDLKRDYYEGNSFDIGDFDPTIGGALSKFPKATLAGLFRPYLWDSRNVVMLLSGAENLFIMGLTLFVLFKLKFKRMGRFIMSNPVILYSLVFSFLFAFMIGLTSPNFGALVRFKIPLIPLYMACLMILLGEVNNKNQQMVSRRL